MLKDNKANLAKLGVVALTAMIAGCAEYEVRKLDKMQPTGSDFSKALASEYRSVAIHEIREFYDDTDSEHFAMKGKEAAAGKGEQVMPDQPASRELPATAVPEVTAAHERLVSALTCHGRAKAPIFAAAAQANFDLWMEELEERWQKNCINMARLDFYENLRKVEEIICPLDNAPQFHVYFALGSDRVGGDAAKVLEEAAAAAGYNCHCKIFLTGRTDAVASRKFNLELSHRRANSVKAVLLQKNIAEKRIVARGFGEVPGSRQYDRKNRHVEIIIH